MIVECVWSEWEPLQKPRDSTQWMKYKYENLSSRKTGKKRNQKTFQHNFYSFLFLLPCSHFSTIVKLELNNFRLYTMTLKGAVVVWLAIVVVAHGINWLNDWGDISCERSEVPLHDRKIFTARHIDHVSDFKTSALRASSTARDFTSSLADQGLCVRAPLIQQLWTTIEKMWMIFMIIRTLKCYLEVILMLEKIWFRRPLRDCVCGTAAAAVLRRRLRLLNRRRPRRVSRVIGNLECVCSLE